MPPTAPSPCAFTRKPRLCWRRTCPPSRCGTTASRPASPSGHGRQGHAVRCPRPAVHRDQAIVDHGPDAEPVPDRGRPRRRPVTPVTGAGSTRRAARPDGVRLEVQHGPLRRPAAAATHPRAARHHIPDLRAWSGSCRETRSPGVAVQRPCPDSYVNAMREQFGLDQPLLVQYGNFLKNLLTGDLGVTSTGSGRRAARRALPGHDPARPARHRDRGPHRHHRRRARRAAARRLHRQRGTALHAVPVSSRSSSPATCCSGCSGCSSDWSTPTCRREARRYTS